MSAISEGLALDWVEFGVELAGDHRPSEATQINWSRSLSSEERRRYHPYDLTYGVGSLGSGSWTDWPDWFRGCVAFRKIEGTFYAYCVRGEPEFLGAPSPRYYSYGLWLILPGEWFDPAQRANQLAVDQLADRVYSAICALLCKPPSLKVQGQQFPLVIARHSLPYAVPLRSVCERAELAGAAAAKHREASDSGLDSARTVVIREPEQHTAADPEQIYEQLAAQLCQMIVAAYLDQRFDAIAVRGIALHPPVEQHLQFAWIVPRPPTAKPLDSFRPVPAMHQASVAPFSVATPLASIPALPEPEVTKASDSQIARDQSSRVYFIFTMFVVVFMFLTTWNLSKWLQKRRQEADCRQKIETIKIDLIRYIESEERRIRDEKIKRCSSLSFPGELSYQSIFDCTWLLSAQSADQGATRGDSDIFKQIDKSIKSEDVCKPN